MLISKEARSPVGPTRIYGFPPILGERPRLLILGSMPSVASLEKHQYYGKPQNAFWRVMAALFDFDPELDYEDRARRLANEGVAIWDVLASCVRPGSLDSAIQPGTEVVNDFENLFQRYPEVGYVFFNGRKAEDVYRKRVLPSVNDLRPDLVYQSLPSTSPAMATLDFSAKLERWRAVAAVLSAG